MGQDVAVITAVSPPTAGWLTYAADGGLLDLDNTRISAHGHNTGYVADRDKYTGGFETGFHMENAANGNANSTLFDQSDANEYHTRWSNVAADSWSVARCAIDSHFAFTIGWDIWVDPKLHAILDRMELAGVIPMLNDRGNRPGVDPNAPDRPLAWYDPTDTTCFVIDGWVRFYQEREARGSRRYIPNFWNEPGGSQNVANGPVSIYGANNPDPTPNDDYWLLFHRPILAAMYAAGFRGAVKMDDCNWQGSAPFGGGFDAFDPNESCLIQYAPTAMAEFPGQIGGSVHVYGAHGRDKAETMLVLLAYINACKAINLTIDIGEYGGRDPANTLGTSTNQNPGLRQTIFEAGEAIYQLALDGDIHGVGLITWASTVLPNSLHGLFSDVGGRQYAWEHDVSQLWYHGKRLYDLIKLNPPSPNPND